MTTIPLNFETTMNDTTAIRMLILFSVLALFDFIMKWIAMYRAWTRRDVARFVCLFIFNTCWILPIIYLATHKKID